jgi:hypothetical protein
MLAVVGSTFCPAIAIDTILNQKGKSVKCIYVAIGQKASIFVSKSEFKLAIFFFLQKPTSVFFVNFGCP